MTTITIPTALAYLLELVIALELWRMRATLFGIVHALSLLAGKMLHIIGKWLYRLVRRRLRRWGHWLREQPRLFADHYWRIANSQGVYKPRNARWTVPGLWLDRLLATAMALVIANQFF